MSRFRRRKDGKFKAKSTEDRKVRSIRATDSAWESLGDIAESQNMTRADLMETMVQGGKLDCIKGIDALQELAHQLHPNCELISIQKLVQQLETDAQIDSLRELVQQLQPIQNLVRKLDPIQKLAQKLEHFQKLAQKLEPIQELAHKLEAIQGVSLLQTLGNDIKVVSDVATGMEALQTTPNQIDVLDKRAIALEMIHQFIKEYSLEQKVANPHEYREYQGLSDLEKWLMQQSEIMPLVHTNGHSND